MGDVINMKWADQLKLEGILCKGYGVLPKYAMCDSDLPLVSKAIYAYFCSLAGNGSTTFPGRDTIVARLHINKESYYKYLKSLEDQGYITRTRQTNALGQFSHNIYKIEEFPKKFQAERNSGTVAFDGIKAAGYGLIPRAVMMDDRLDAKSKAIYAYFACFTGRGEAAFPKVDAILYHLGITYKTYHKYYTALVNLNFMKVSQRHEDGRLGSNYYTLLNNPDEAQAVSIHESSKTRTVSFTKPRQNRRQISKIPDMDKNAGIQDVHELGKIPDKVEIIAPEQISQLGKIPDGAYQDRENQNERKQDNVKQDKTKKDTIIPSSFIPSASNTNFENYQSIYLSDTELIDKMDRISIRKFLYNRLGFPQAFKDTLYFEDVFHLIDLVAVTLAQKAPFYRIGGENKTREDVVNTFISLEVECYEYVAAQMQDTSRKIKNPVAYYLTALYNSAATIGICKKQLENDEFFFPPEWEVGN